MKYLLIYFFITTVSVSGCTDSNNRSSSSTSIEQATTENSAEISKGNGNNSTPLLPLSEFLTTGCKAIGTAFTWPPDTGPTPSVPIEWAPRGHLGDTVELDLYECNRLAWGPFERPIHILIESHDRFDPPNDCRQGKFNLMLAMNAFWIDDLVVGNWLRNTYGLPILIGNITHDAVPLNDGVHNTWKWKVLGEKYSILEDWNSNQLQKGEHVLRWFWFNSTSVSFVDWHDVDEHSIIESTVQTGEMHEPMLYSTTPYPPQYVGRGQSYYDLNVDGSIHRFLDLECKQPVPGWPA